MLTSAIPIFDGPVPGTDGYVIMTVQIEPGTFRLRRVPPGPAGGGLLSVNTGLLPDSDLYYPSQHAVKTYVDASVSSEATARATAVSAEAAARAAADTTLQTNIESEEDSRIAGDIFLQEQVDNKESAYVSLTVAKSAVATWTARTAPAVGLWRDVVWAEELGLFVSLSELGGATPTTDKGMTSPDGVNWTKRTTAGVSADTWRAIAWSPEKQLLVAVAASGSVQTSPDGVNWTIGVAASAAVWTGVTYSADLGRFVAVGTDATMWSDDGFAWTLGSMPANQWQRIIWVPELALFVTNSFGGVGTSRIATSADGQTFSFGATSAIGDGNTGLAWSTYEKILVNVSTTGAIYTSPDAVTWTARTAASAQFFNDTAWSPELNLFVAVAQTGTASQRVQSSRDGITWTAHTVPSGTNNWRSLCWSKQLMRFVVVGPTAGASNEIITSATPTSFLPRAIIGVSGADLTNNVTAGGTDDTIANFTDLTTYATDAAAIRNDIYQLARKVKQINDALRAAGLLT